MANQVEKYAPRTQTVGGLLGDIENDQIAVPEIQRPFVWQRTKVRDLLDSLYRGYPTGYIIIWQSHDIPLKDGTISSGKKIIIDGQQRITALMTAIAGKQVIDSDYKKDRVKIAFNPFNALDESKGLPLFEVQTPAHVKSSKWIEDIHVIFNNSFNAFNFITKYCNDNPDMSTQDLSNIIDKLRGILNRQIGVIELSSILDIDVVTDIFIRINSTGTPLEASDFVMSRIAADDVHGGQLLRKAIDYFAHLIEEPTHFSTIQNNDAAFVASPYFSKMTWMQTSTFSVFKPSYDDIIRIAFMSEYSRSKLGDLVALLSGRDFDTKTYNGAVVDDTYDKLKAGVLNVINKDNFQNFVQAIIGCGFISDKLVNSKMALDFAYTLYLRLKNDPTVSLSERKKLVQKWYVMSVLTRRYGGSPESVFGKDINDIEEKGVRQALADIENATFSSTYWDVMVPQQLENSSTTNPILLVYLAAQVFNNDKALLSNSVNVRDLIDIIGDVHHIFPRAYLKKNGCSQKEYNQDGNYALLDTQINKDIGERPPCVYLQEALNQCTTKTIVCGTITDINVLKSNLQANCIPAGTEKMDFSNYNDFLIKRRSLMAKKIKAFYNAL